MKAMVTHSYGSPDVLKLAEVEKPVPGDDEVLVKVHAASANAGDWHLLRGKPFLVRFMFGLLAPKFKVLGADAAGRVEAVGSRVTQFKPGDEVFGDLSDAGFGGFGEYITVPQETLALKPANLSFEEAATVPSAGLTALQGLRRHAQVRPGQKVLINGASGGVGTFAVQIAKALGAEVTGVCSTRNVEMVRSIGADHVVDYKQEDFTQNGEQYDLILDAAAFRPIAEFKRSLTPQGVYLQVGGSGAQFLEIMVKGPFLTKKGGQRFGNYLKHANQEDLLFLKELLETGKIAPVIDRRYPLQELPDAIRYLEAGHARGKVIVTIAEPVPAVDAMPQPAIAGAPA